MELAKRHLNRVSTRILKGRVGGAERLARAGEQGKSIVSISGLQTEDPVYRAKLLDLILERETPSLAHWVLPDDARHVFVPYR